MKPSVTALEQLFDAVVTGLAGRLADDDLCSAADFSNAIKLLKDNNITAVMEDNTKLAEMQAKVAALNAKRRTRGSSVVSMVPAEVTPDEAHAAVEQAIAMNGS